MKLHFELEVAFHLENDDGKKVKLRKVVKDFLA